LRIEVVSHETGWAAAFDEEARLLETALGSVAVRIHHIGSTAIPAISAKPVIDILIEASALGALDLRTEEMRGLGYESMGEFGIPGRRYFRKTDSRGQRTHHVHAFAVGDPEIQRHLAFRDYLRAHPEIANRYGALKAELAARHADDPDAYMDGKDPFIREHERLALVWAASYS
jgi:GrpB-like predicted nucleotidyltransferase (UPF0157 family)